MHFCMESLYNGNRSQGSEEWERFHGIAAFPDNIVLLFWYGGVTSTANQARWRGFDRQSGMAAGRRSDRGEKIEIGKGVLFERK